MHAAHVMRNALPVAVNPLTGSWICARTLLNDSCRRTKRATVIIETFFRNCVDIKERCYLLSLRETSNNIIIYSKTKLSIKKILTSYLNY